MKRKLAALARAFVVMALAAGCKPNAPVRPLRVHLEAGDSVEVAGWYTAVVPDRSQGLLLGYHPFIPMQDTLGLRRIAVALWHAYARPVAEEHGVDWVVLQSQSWPDPRAVVPTTRKTYGVVLERRADGNWYFLRSGQRVE
jgi:hypothetical protein